MRAKVTPMIFFALLASSIAEKARKGLPSLGHATDRRSLRQVGEVFAEDTIEVLMCFVCCCKFITHRGFDKFGEPQEKGDICYRANDNNNDTLHRILTGDATTNLQEQWRYNFSYNFFLERFGEPVRTDPTLQDYCYEWRRKIEYQGAVLELICSPEDVRATVLCIHKKKETLC